MTSSSPSSRLSSSSHHSTTTTTTPTAESDQLDELDSLMNQLFPSASSRSAAPASPLRRSRLSLSSPPSPSGSPFTTNTSTSPPQSPTPTPVQRPRTLSHNSASRIRAMSSTLLKRHSSGGSSIGGISLSRKSSGDLKSLHSIGTQVETEGGGSLTTSEATESTVSTSSDVEIDADVEAEVGVEVGDDVDSELELPSPPLRPINPRSASSKKKFIPRSARNERTLIADDLDFLKDEPTSPRPGSVCSNHSPSTSVRNLRLRQDIEKTVLDLKSRSSNEGLLKERNSSGGSLNSRLSSDQSSLKRSTLVTGSGGVNGGSSESPIEIQPPQTAGAASFDLDRTGGGEGSETHSMASGISSSHNSLSSPFSPISACGSGSLSDKVFSWSHYSGGGVGSTSETGSFDGSTGGGSIGIQLEAKREKGSERERQHGRQRELKEWSQSCWVWQKDKGGSSSGGGGMLSKTPLIREVPAAMKRKMGKRDSSHQLLLTDNFVPHFEDTGVGGGGNKAGKVPLREKTSRSTFGIGPTSATKDAAWRKVTGVLRDDGYFRIFSEDSVILHSIHLPSIPRTDVRQVDQSLFHRPNVVVIHRRSISPATPSASSASMTFSKSQGPHHPSSSNSAPHPASTSFRALDEPIYLAMPSIVAMQSWIVMAHCFARPEFLSNSPLPGVVLPARAGLRRRGSTSWSTDDDDEDVNDNEKEELNASSAAEGEEQVDLRCRIFRSIYVSINEGRGIGEAGTESVRNFGGPKNGLDRRPDLDRGESSSSSFSNDIGSINSFESPNKTSSNPSFRSSSNRYKEDLGLSGGGLDTFCEILIEGEVVARTSVRKGTTAPFWNEAFTFSDLPPIISPLTIKIFQTHRASRPTLIGTAVVRIPDLNRSELLEDWWSVKPTSFEARGKPSDTVGQLSLSVKVDEEVVLPGAEYEGLLQLLNNDADAELAKDLTQEFPGDLEEMSKLLLRIYQAENLLIPRILRLTELEIDGDLNSAAILFRGNSVLTKSIELYLRLIGTEYLDVSIGEPIRRLCASKVDIEIDPSKMKPGLKDNELASNINELREWTTNVWNAIYDARERCPNEIRQIFAHIQKIVSSRYGDEHHKKMRSTSVSAFIFLRFFVPAVLNPKLFNLVSVSPDPKSQRALTLVAKTLQGLANFSTFGQKEPWMGVMNSFVQDNTSAFIDFIRHISTPSPTVRVEWTSPTSSVYLAPYRLRNLLPEHTREGIPLLPHLLDLPRDLGLLASHVARGIADRDRSNRPASAQAGAAGDSSSISVNSRSSRSAKFEVFTDRCLDVHEEARKRGGGLVGHHPLPSAKPHRHSLRALPRGATAQGSAWTRNIDNADLPRTPPRKTGAPKPEERGLEEDSDDDEDVLSIRAPSVPALGPSPSSVTSRRSHRSFTVSGIPLRPMTSPLYSMSTDDLDLLHAAPVSEVFVMRHPSPSPISVDSFSSPQLPSTEDEFDSPTSSYVFPSRPAALRSAPVQISQSTTTTISRRRDASDNSTADTVTTAEEDLDQEDVDVEPVPFASTRGTHMGMSIPMETQLSSSSQTSTLSQSSTISSSNASTVSVIGEVSVAQAQVVDAGRRPSLPGVMGLFMSEDPFADGGKKRGILARMGRKNSRAGGTSA